jgi:hypothetical protein
MFLAKSKIYGEGEDLSASEFQYFCILTKLFEKLRKL